MRMIRVTVACLLAPAGAAWGSTVTYTSAPLAPVSSGGNGATQVTVSAVLPSLPAPGKCVTTYRLAAYSDGAHTLHSLRAGGYTIVRSVIKEIGSREIVVPETYATICLTKDGTTVSGRYQVLATRTAGIAYFQYLADNQEVGGTDRVEIDLYLGGEVPQVYSNLSAQPGTWTVTP